MDAHPLYVKQVVSKSDCKKHKSRTNEPCWLIYNSNGTMGFAICNARAKRAGFNHPIDPKSLRRTQNQDRIKYNDRQNRARSSES